MKKQADQQPETTTLSDDSLALATGGQSLGPVLGPVQGPIFPGVSFDDYPKRKINPNEIR